MTGVVHEAGVPETRRRTWDTARSLTVGAAALGAVLGLARYGFTARGLITACLLGVLGAVAVIDFREHIVPVRVVLPASAVLLMLQLVLFPANALEWVLAPTLAFAFLASLWLVKRDGIALEDATLGLLLGAGLGADVAVAMFVGFLALWPAAIYLLLRDGVDARKATVPITPALAIGAVLVVFAA
jgi:hypothetical protein